MNSYDEGMAPAFAQILLQREFVQHEVLRQIDERFKTDSTALSLSGSEFSDFERASLELKDLWSARRRIKDGRYGKCVGCGEPIDLRRLSASPTTVLCGLCDDKSHRTARKNSWRSN